MTCVKFSNFNMTNISYQPLAQAIGSRHIVLKEDECKVLISRTEADFKLPVGMRNYLRKNGYNVFYFDFPDEHRISRKENPFEGEYGTSRAKPWREPASIFCRLDYSHGNSHAALCC